MAQGPSPRRPIDDADICDPVAREREAKRLSAHAPANDEHIEGRFAIWAWHARHPVGRRIAQALEIAPGFGGQRFEAGVWGVGSPAAGAHWIATA